MKISSSTGVAPQAAGNAAGRPAQGRASEAAAQPGAGATVSLSPLSTQLVSGSAGPDFDHAKVESIKQAIADGKLSVNADAVADKLIANALALSNGSAS